VPISRFRTLYIFQFPLVVLEQASFEKAAEPVAVLKYARIQDFNFKCVSARSPSMMSGYDELWLPDSPAVLSRLISTPSLYISRLEEDGDQE
jgi:hypothetical protein